MDVSKVVGLTIIAQTSDNAGAITFTMCDGSIVYIEPDNIYPGYWLQKIESVVGESFSAFIPREQWENGDIMELEIVFVSGKKILIEADGREQGYHIDITHTPDWQEF